MEELDIKDNKREFFTAEVLRNYLCKVINVKLPSSHLVVNEEKSFRNEEFYNEMENISMEVEGASGIFTEDTYSMINAVTDIADMLEAVSEAKKEFGLDGTERLEDIDGILFDIDSLFLLHIGEDFFTSIVISALLGKYSDFSSSKKTIDWILTIAKSLIEVLSKYEKIQSTMPLSKGDISEDVNTSKLVVGQVYKNYGNCSEPLLASY